jgi:RNA polymerase-binding transcription factor DksA
MSFCTIDFAADAQWGRRAHEESNHQLKVPGCPQGERSRPGTRIAKRDDIAIEKSVDQIDEIQHATERDLAMRNKDRESILLREVKAALERLRDGSFGTCIQCDDLISPKRLAAVP